MFAIFSLLLFLTTMYQVTLFASFFFKKSDALYFFPTNWILLAAIEKFNIIEFSMLIRNLFFLVPPSTLKEHIHGVSQETYTFQISPGFFASFTIVFIYFFVS